MGNLFLAMEIDYGMSSFIARNKLPTLWPNSYLHTQASEIQVATKWSKQRESLFGGLEWTTGTLEWTTGTCLSQV